MTMLTKLLFFIGVLMMLACIAQASASSSSTMPQQKQQQVIKFKRRSYLWKASLHGATGIASSLEQSLFQQSKKQQLILGGKAHARAVHEFATKIFSDYPNFLQRPSLTLGLCRTVDGSNSSSGGSISNLQTSVMPLDLLTFGTPKDVTSKYRTKTIQVQRKKSRQGAHQRINQCGKVLCCIEIPIIGGLLAITDNKKSTSVKEDNGCLRFSWVQPLNNNEEDQKQQQQQDPNEIILITEIAGNYHPSLAGHTIPIPTWRNIFYCSTQRMVHTYVMWRFHGFVMEEYMKSYSNLGDDGELKDNHYDHGGVLYLVSWEERWKSVMQGIVAFCIAGVIFSFACFWAFFLLVFSNNDPSRGATRAHGPSFLPLHIVDQAIDGLE